MILLHIDQSRSLKDLSMNTTYIVQYIMKEHLCDLIPHNEVLMCQKDKLQKKKHQNKQKFPI